MTREAEKQKSIFRKLSQGGEGTAQKHAKPSHTSAPSGGDHSLKKTLTHAPKKALHESKHEETHATHEEKTHTTHAPSSHEEKHVDVHATHAPGKHEDTHTTHAPSKHESKHVDTHTTHAPSKHEDTHATHAPSKHVDTHSTRDTGHGSAGDSHSIFKGYTGETHKADDRVFKKKKHKIAYGDSKNSFSSVKYFVQNKWYSSRIHKIWICAAGYIFATQAWLCVVAFFCVVIWRIREKA
jgi:hypothetical protein